MEDKESQNNHLKLAVLEKIKTGQVKMRPKAFFIAKIAALVVVAAVTFIISVLLISYTWFSLRAGGHIFLLGFGRRGLFEFFLLFPWFLLLVDIALILFFDWLLKRFKFGYHSPVIYIFIGSIVIVTVLGTVVNMTSFHRNIMRIAEQRGSSVPFIGGFYSGLRRTHQENGIFRGQVVSVATSSFVIKNITSDGDEDIGDIEILTPSGLDVSMLLNVGDEVFVAGDVDIGSTTEVHAYGIRKLTPDD